MAICFNQSEADLGSGTSPVWNFCYCSSDAISQGNLKWIRKSWLFSISAIKNTFKYRYVFYAVTCLAGGLTVIKVLYTEFTRAKSSMFFTNTWIINPFFKLAFKLLSVSMEIKIDTKFLVVPSEFEWLF